MSLETKFGLYLQNLRLKKKLTIRQLALKSGISTSQISRIETGRRGIPKPETIKKLAKALDVPYNELMFQAGYLDWEQLSIWISESVELDKNGEFRDILLYLFEMLEHLYSSETFPSEIFENLKHESIKLGFKIDESYFKSETLTALMDLKSKITERLQQNKKTEHLELKPYEASEMVRVPILGTIRAGDPIERLEYNEGYTLVDPEILKNSEGFALKVKGDSMSGDNIYDGYVVIVKVQKEVTPHDIAVVAVNHEEATLKRVRIVGDFAILTPSNPAYEQLVIPTKDIEILGKVVEVKFWPK